MNLHTSTCRYFLALSAIPAIALLVSSRTCAASTASFPAPLFVAGYSAYLINGTNLDNQEQNNTFGTTSAIMDTFGTATYSTYSQQYSVFALARPGQLRVSASNSITCTACSGVNPPATHQGNQWGAYSQASWQDQAQVMNTGNTPPGSVQFTFALNGSFLPTPSDTPPSNSGLGLDWGYIQGSTESPDSSRGFTTNPNGSVSLNFAPPNASQSFIFYINLTAAAFTYGTLTGASSETVDFSHSLDLTGISVLDSSGNVIPGATVQLASSVPEPATGFLMAIGASVFLLRLSWTCRRHDAV